MSPWSYALLGAVGFAASVVNVVAGGGSFLTLPVLIFMGLPVADANGTNRVGVIAQSAGAVWGFHRRRILDWPWALASGIPTALGGLAGAWLALRVDDRDFRRILATLMVALTLWTLFDPLGRIGAVRPRSPRSPEVVIGFLIAGLYGGFVQAGVGFLVLAVTALSGLDLVRGSGVKVFAVLVPTLVSLLVFAAQGRVDWPAGLALSAGSLAGAAAGVRLTVLAGQRWLGRLVSATVIVFAALLWL